MVLDMEDDKVTVKFMVPGSLKSFFKWPEQVDVQSVHKKFILHVMEDAPAICNNGRLYFLSSFNMISTLYDKYCKVYF